MSRLLFSSPAFVKLAERSLSEARHHVQDSSGEMCSTTTSPVTGGGSSLLDTFRGVRIFTHLWRFLGFFDEKSVCAGSGI
jgi:hypothetical protein